jgi:hypothetical protein
MKHRNRETLQKAITESFRREIWNRFLVGKELMEDIAKSFGKSRQAIGYHIQKCMEEYHAQNMTDAGNYLRKEIEICNKGTADAWRLYYEAMDSWEKTKGSHVVKTITGKTLNRKDGKARAKIELDASTAEIQEKTEESAGDPRLLKLAMEAQELIREWHIRRCKLQGFEAPKTQINIGGDVNITSARQYIIGELSSIASRQATGRLAQ